MSRSWHGRDKTRPLARLWKQGDRTRLARKQAKADRKIDVTDRQEVFDAVVDELTARAVHCFIDEKGDVRIVAA